MAKRVSLRRCKRSKAWSEHQLYTRRYHSDVNRFKEWCEENNVSYETYDTAGPNDICVLSMNEYHLHDTRKMIYEDSEDYFLNSEDYEKWCES